MPILSVLIFLPLLFILILSFLPEGKVLRFSVFGFSLMHFVYSLYLLVAFDKSTADLQFAEIQHWVPDFGIKYFVAVDGLSIWLVLLTTFLCPLVVLATWTSVTERLKLFYGSIFALQSAMLGTFLAFDAILFYTFFELGLVPMYMLIGIWGGKRRLYATMKFFIYTMAGSVLMLMGIIYMMLLCSEQLGQISSNLLDFYRLNIPFVGGTFLNSQTLLFFAFGIAFAIKVPMIPFHTWLPDAHVEAPTAGSVILAGVMLKMGTYGFLRFSLPLFPDASSYWAWVVLFLGVLGIVYGALVAMVQPDMKKLVAYSSVSHMGYIVVGLFSLNAQGVTGGIYQMLNHGISTGALFLLVGMIYDRTHSREIAKYGGLASRMPLFTILFFIATFSSIAVPLTNGFIGEFLILIGLYKAAPAFAYVAVLGVVLGAVYMLWMCKKVFFGKESELVGDTSHPLLDLNPRELSLMAPLVILIFWMGIFPGHFLQYTEASVNHLIKSQQNYELNVKAVSNGK